ncbi:MAG: OmpA family protein [Deltaproteobacteria bacterium]|nr:OmpA family protein [Deltaproteobacteria bacterium]
MSRALASVGILALTFFVAGCPSKPYPNCDNDKDCREGEFCVNKKCQQCRQSSDCDKGQTCKGGRCERIEGFCENNFECPEGKVCKSNRCTACQNDGECGDGGRCRNGRCLAPGQCSSDDDCPENYECQANRCVAPPKPAAAGPCTPAAVYFNFDEFVLTSDATSALQEAAKCIKSVQGRTVRIEGHCDPRGTEEYNLALGDRRARSVVNHLKRLGVPSNRLRPVSKGKLEATGSDETSWARDRKVLFIWE